MSKDRFAMEVPLFSKWWEIALFWLLGLLLLPFFMLLYVWESLKKDKGDED
jgi:hypothetical protein